MNATDRLHADGLSSISMNVLLDPPMDRWSPLDRPDADDRRHGLIELADRSARRLGTAPLTRIDRLLATGHQADLWHPGILAKDIAAALAAPRLLAAPLHVVVDQDTLDELALDLPVVRDQRAGLHRLVLARFPADVPTASLPALRPASLLDALRRAQHQLGDALIVSLEPLVQALAESDAAIDDRGDAPPLTLAQQLARVLARLMQPLIGAMPMVFASDLLDLPAGRALLARMVRDAHDCARAYNRAVTDHPQARVATLRVEGRPPRRVELPLWAIAPGAARQRVFVKVGDDLPGDDPAPPHHLELDDGRPALAGPERRLAPKALTLTALLRSDLCDLFIHGKGGAVYDAATEDWCRRWGGIELAPRATVSADLYHRYHVPLAEPSELDRAVWWLHHLPHNIDRHVPLDPPDLAPAQRKRELLARTDGTRTQRAERFAELHRLNHELARRHPDALDAARLQRDRAALGLANRTVARRRDGCFALYPPDSLRQLRDAIAHQSPPAPPQSEMP